MTSAKAEAFRIEVNEEQCIHHLKASNAKEFGIWLERMQQHQYYQLKLTKGEDPFETKCLENNHIMETPVVNGNLSPPKNESYSSHPTSGRVGTTPGVINDAIDPLMEFSLLDNGLMENLLILQEGVVEI